jgi:hypothetical protein
MADLGPFERIRTGPVPVAALAFILCAIAIEVFVQTHHDWVADLAAWQWETKRTLMDEGALDGEVAIFGTSVLFHGIDPTVANVDTDGGKAVNLALNGMMLQHQTQLLRDRLASAHPPSVLLLEFRHVMVERDSWIRGPYFRLWASFGEFAESRFYYWNPPLALTFATNRSLASFRYREAIDNWLTESARRRGLYRETRDRNQATVEEMRQHRGLVRAVFEDQILRAQERRERPWVVNTAGEIWVRRFLDLAEAHQLPVVLLLPPSPPYFVESPGPDGFRAHFDATVSRLRHEYPALEIELFEPFGYGMDDFVDDFHVSRQGRVKFSSDFAAWLAASRTRLGIRSASLTLRR